MVSVVSLLLLIALIGFHTLGSAILMRYFRVRLKTRWGWLLYSALLPPVPLFVSTLVFTGPLGIGFDLGSPAAALALTIALPMALGFTIDVLYVPSPEEYELPDTAE
ncbi:MAG: hypothetical protein V5A46_01915 [Haloferacaceae archaeon]